MLVARVALLAVLKSIVPSRDRGVGHGAPLKNRPQQHGIIHLQVLGTGWALVAIAAVDHLHLVCPG